MLEVHLHTEVHTMKPFRSALLLAFALSTSACGIDSESEFAATESDALDTQAQAATTPSLPNSCPGNIPCAPAGRPTAPTPISSIPEGRALYRPVTSLRSAYTVVVTDPRDSDAFLAFGFDVRSRSLQFYVSGSKSRGDLRRLNAQIAKDIEVIEQSTGFDPGFDWGSSGQVGGPLIPRPGVYEDAWEVAFKNHDQLNRRLVTP
jgi:hypothetical protein